MVLALVVYTRGEVGGWGGDRETQGAWQHAWMAWLCVCVWVAVRKMRAGRQ